jgi:hypothetical protein
MNFTQRQYVFIGVFAAFWTLFMLLWSGDYRPARIAILLVVGVIVALAWGWAMKKWGGWKEQG